MNWDILLDQNGELQQDGNDVLMGDASNNYIEAIVVSDKGNFIEFPLLGVGIYKYVNSDSSQAKIVKEIKKQLKYDVFKNPLVNAANFPYNLIINAVLLEFDANN